MNFKFASLRAQAHSFAGRVMLIALLGPAGLAQRPQPRILAPVDSSARMALAGSRPAQALAGTDAGRLAADMQIQGGSITLGRSEGQQSALDALVAAQQTPGSALYHQWLSPDDFAARFGAADADLAKVKGWLESQGLSVTEVSRNRSQIFFAGSVAQIERAFGTEMHFVQVGGEKHFAPNSDVTLPSAFAGAVLSVGNLSDFKPRSHMLRVPATDVALNAGSIPGLAGDGVKANFTSNQSGNHFQTPGDVAVIYDVNAAYSAGYTGSGQTIAVIGQSAVINSDITNFQSAAGVPVRVPQLVLMPGSGTSTLFTGDEGESDLDLEYTSAIAKGATISFVYTGNSPNYGAFDALNYAISNRLAPILSVSYGLCEASLSLANYNLLNGELQQAAAQGQTVIAAAGDDGSTDCYRQTGLTAALQGGLGIDFPGGSQYVTAMGGTEYQAVDVSGTNASQYWITATGSDVIASAKSYIPEQIWNDDSSTSGLSSGGGGASIYTANPSWQTGVPGMTANSFRTVPDISLSSSPNVAGYLYCSSDSSTGITGSCANGFRDINSTNLTIAGGTSFAAPIFSGMLALINQKIGSTGQGLINPTLYKLAANAATYATAFHDVTLGNNGCTAGLTYPDGTNTSNQTTYGPACTTAEGGQFAAGPGYDLASGLGSIDLFNLLSAWPAAGTGSSVSLAASTLTPSAGTVVAIAITVKGTNAVPTGMVSVAVDGGTATSVTLTPGATAATATYNFSSSVTGTHTIAVSYAGDANNPASSASISVTVSAPGSFTVTAPATSIASGGSGTVTLTVTPTGGYTGTLNLTMNSTIANACYTLPNAVVTSAAAVTVSATVYTNGTTNCPSGATTLARAGSGVKTAATLPTLPSPGRKLPFEIAMAGLFAVGVLGRRSRKLRGIIVMALLAVAGLGLSGCGSGGSVGSGAGVGISTKAPTGTYTVSITATDSVTASRTAAGTFTLTIQ